MLVTDGYHILALPLLRAGNAVHPHPRTPQDTIITPVLERESEGWQQQKCAQTSVCLAELKPCVLCGGWRRDAGTDWPELQVNGNQSKAALNGPLPQPLSGYAFPS